MHKTSRSGDDETHTCLLSRRPAARAFTLAISLIVRQVAACERLTMRREDLRPTRSSDAGTRSNVFASVDPNLR